MFSVPKLVACHLFQVRNIHAIIVNKQTSIHDQEVAMLHISMCNIELPKLANGCKYFCAVIGSLRFVKVSLNKSIQGVLTHSI